MSRKKLKILLVDDEDDARELFLDLLKTKTSFQVETAVNGNDAYAKLESDSFDLLITDVVMPELDGIDLVNKLRSSNLDCKDMKVIINSNLGGYYSLKQAYDIGALDYIMPIDVSADEFVNRVKDVAEGKITSSVVFTNNPKYSDPSADNFVSPQTVPVNNSYSIQNVVGCLYIGAILLFLYLILSSLFANNFGAAIAWVIIGIIVLWVLSLFSD